MPRPIQLPQPPDRGESTARPSGVLAAARGFLSGRRSGQTPSPSIPVPPSTGDGSNSVNPMLPERRERPISTSEQRRRSAFESLRCELAHRRANYINTSPITSPPDRSE
jgi:hypothetical protein